MCERNLNQTRYLETWNWRSGLEDGGARDGERGGGGAFILRY